MAPILRLGLAAATMLGFSGKVVAQVEPLEREVARIAAAAPAKVGVGIVHVESGRSVFVNRGEWFPMASTYKVPMAVEVLSRVDRGDLRLDSLVPIERADVVPFGSLLTDRFGEGEPGAVLSVRRYLELMLRLSDNTATDILLRLTGGTAATQRRIDELGITGMQVSRTVMELGADWIGLALPPWRERTVDGIRQLMAASTPEQVRAGSRAFLASRRDHTTPEAMANLLARLVRGGVLTPASTELLWSIMAREETGAARIRGRLPADVRTANKTGTLDVTIQNDVGVIFLPDGTHLALAVYTTEATRPLAELSRVIADIARAAYDYFALHGSGLGH